MIAALGCICKINKGIEDDAVNTWRIRIMCTKIVINKLYLGNRELGYELFSDGEIIEMTEKQIVSEIKSGKDIRGLVIGESGKLELDAAGFGMRNLMEKRHIGNYKPMIEDGCMVNMFVTVIGSKETENGVVYEGITNRFKRMEIDEALLLLITTWDSLMVVLS